LGFILQRRPAIVHAGRNVWLAYGVDSELLAGS